MFLLLDIQSVGPVKALYTCPLAYLFIPTPVHFSAEPFIHIATSAPRVFTHNIFLQLSIASYLCLQPSELRIREDKENAQAAKRHQPWFKPGLSYGAL